MPTTWKEDANRRRDERHISEGPEETGPRKAGKPSPQKRERLTPIWVVQNVTVSPRSETRVVIVSAEKRYQAEKKGREQLKTDRIRAYVLHQKDRVIFADVIDTGKTFSYWELNRRWLAKPDE